MWNELKGDGSYSRYVFRFVHYYNMYILWIIAIELTGEFLYPSQMEQVWAHPHIDQMLKTHKHTISEDSQEITVLRNPRSIYNNDNDFSRISSRIQRRMTEEEATLKYNMPSFT